MLHVIDIAPLDEIDPLESAKVIIDELAAYSPDLLNKPRWIVFNKIDMLPDEQARQQVIQHVIDGLHWEGKYFAISAIRSEGTQQLCYALMELIDEMKASESVSDSEMDSEMEEPNPE